MDPIEQNKINTTSESESESPVIAAPTVKSTRPRTNQDWWPDQLNLSVLNQHERRSDPMGDDFNYAAEVQTINFDKLKADMFGVMTDSQDWWPADYGHYGPFFIRMAWHSAGTYRTADGRGGGGNGLQRFAPLNSWPDNANLDKARRLLWPIKQKYGRKLSWADLMVLAGNCALESMGFSTFGFAFGREDVYEPNEIFWGPEDTWLGDERYAEGEERALTGALGAVQMGLIYVNPEGPGGNPDPLASAYDIRETFGRMAMNDEETVALIVGGHTFGKCHGAVSPEYVGTEPEGCPVHAQGFGWTNSFGKGNGVDTITSGLEGAWTADPIKWDNGYLDNLYNFDWELAQSPAGAKQWTPKSNAAQDQVPDAHDSSKRLAPIMLTSDLAIKVDPQYALISKRFHENPDQLADAFGKAWYKLLHRDMGPVSRLLGPWVPETQLWQDPVPAANSEPTTATDIATLKASLLNSGLSVSQLVRTAWASAASFRQTDMRGGANGARIRLAPQKDWDVNEPKELAKVLKALESVQQTFNASGGVQVSLADVIVLGGCAGVEQAAKNAGFNVTVPFTPGRTDASQEQTDIESFAFLEPMADGFRNYVRAGEKLSPETLFLDRANMLNLTAPESTVLVAGMRAIGANFANSKHGLFSEQREMLNNEFLVNLLDMSTEWSPAKHGDDIYEGRDRSTKKSKWTATAVDLLFGSNSQLRALAEVYAADDAKEKFVSDFVEAWDKVMNLDRFDAR